MIGTPVALVTHAGFWLLLAYGWFGGEVGPRGAVVFLLLWLAGLFGLPLVPFGQPFFLPLVAVLDIALVLAVLKGDVVLK